MRLKTNKLEEKVGDFITDIIAIVNETEYFVLVAVNEEDKGKLSEAFKEIAQGG